MRKKLSKCIFCGTAGFGLGGALWGCIYSFSRGEMYETYIVLGGLLFGMIGGFFLALLRKENKFRLIFFSAIGYVLTGFLLYHPSIIVLTLIFPFFVAISITRVLIGGFFVGLAVKKIKLFTLFGALGYLVGRFVAEVFSTIFGRGGSILESMVVFGSEGLMIGLFLGIGMYIAERNKVSK